MKKVGFAINTVFSIIVTIVFWGVMIAFINGI